LIALAMLAIFPRQRRALFRLILRLLSAGSVHPTLGHVHRKRREHQRRNR
jgi:hypothetical protein